MMAASRRSESWEATGRRNATKDERGPQAAGDATTGNRPTAEAGGRRVGADAAGSARSAGERAGTLTAVYNRRTDLIAFDGCANGGSTTAAQTGVKPQS